MCWSDDRLCRAAAVDGLPLNVIVVADICDHGGAAAAGDSLGRAVAIYDGSLG